MRSSALIAAARLGRLDDVLLLATVNGGSFFPVRLGVQIGDAKDVSIGILFRNVLMRFDVVEDEDDADDILFGV